MLYSCTAGAYVAAREGKIGDQIRAISYAGSEPEPVCSEVYYTYKHKSPSLNAVAIQVDGDDSPVIQVSEHHLVYVGASHQQRQAVLAKNVKPGDVLLSSTGKKTVLSVQPALMDLVSVLTFEPALELQGGVVVSAYSYHDYLYPVLFWPFRVMYNIFGSASVESAKPALDMIDTWVAQPLVALAYQ